MSLSRCLALCGWILLVTGMVTAQEVDVWSRPVQFERSHDFDVLHYAISLELAAATRSYAGETIVTLRALRAGFDSCALDAETFRVTAVRMQRGGPVRFRQEPGRLIVFFSKAFAYGDTLSFAVSYVADNVDVDEERFGMSKGYDLGLSFKPATDRHSEIINTLSFPTGARHWFPCYDHPNDKATTEVTATIDDRFALLSNGDLVSVRSNAARKTKTWHWSQRQPHATYLTVLVAGDYVVLEDSLGALPIHYWVYRSDEQNGMRTFGRTPEIISFFNATFGVPYPWTKYDQIAIPGIGGGAESTTATVIGESAVIDDRAELDWPSGWLVAHEAAHQWWGDYVTMRDWSHTWLNESFATYYEYVWSRHAYGDDEGAWNIENKRRQYYREAETKYRRPIVFNRWDWPNENFDSHTYPKGGAVLHMLRAELGPESFDAAISHYLRSHPYGSVDTHDLLIAIREATGRVMDPFFDQWIYGAGHPELDVTWTYDGQKGVVLLTVRQVQQRNEHVGLFRFPVDVGLKMPGGSSVQRILVSEEQETFVFSSGARPKAVRFDAGNLLLAKVTYTCAPEEDLVHLAGGDVIARRLAIERLRSALGRDDVREALMRAGKEDQFWRVRALAVRVLGGTTWEGQDQYLRERLSDPVSGVRAAAIQSIGEARTKNMVPSLMEMFEAEKSYLVQSEIVKTVGMLDGEAQRPFIERAGSLPSFRSVLRNAADAVLAGLQKK